MADKVLDDKFQSLVRRSHEGEAEAMADLIHYAWANKERKDVPLLAAKTLDSCLGEATTQNVWCIVASLYRDGGDQERYLEMLTNLANEGYHSALWRLGRLHVYSLVESSDWDYGMRLLEKANSLGHLKAPQTIARANAMKSRFPKSLFYYLITYSWGTFMVFRRFVLRINDEKSS